MSRQRKHKQGNRSQFESRDFSWHAVGVGCHGYDMPAPFPHCCVACREGTSPAGGPREVERKKGTVEKEGERGEQGLLGGGAHRTSRGIAPAAGVKGINQTE